MIQFILEKGDEMNKKVYSMVLTEEVVASIDLLAHKMHTNRSNMINQILADYCSFTTPEKRISNIINYLEELVDDEQHQIMVKPTGSVISLKSSLNYRYNPSFLYTVELYRDTKDAIGYLKIQFRTQNQTLLEQLNTFFSFWIELEKENADRSNNKVAEYVISDGRFEREFLVPTDIDLHTSEHLAQAIAEYVQIFDRSIKAFFREHKKGIEQTKSTVRKQYTDFMKNTDYII